RQVTAGDQGNTFTLTDTFQNKADTAQTELNTGSGDDTVNVEHTSGRLQINGVGGQDTVRLGRDHSVRGLKADVDVANDDGATKLIVDDQADTGPRTVLMTTFFAVGSIEGLAPAVIEYVGPNIGKLIVNGGSGGNTFEVNDTLTNPVTFLPTVINCGSGNDQVRVRRTTTSLVVNGQDGDDRITVGNDVNTLDDIDASITVKAGVDKDKLDVHDQASTTPHTYTKT